MCVCVCLVCVCVCVRCQWAFSQEVSLILLPIAAGYNGNLPCTRVFCQVIKSTLCVCVSACEYTYNTEEDCIAVWECVRVCVSVCPCVCGSLY